MSVKLLVPSIEMRLRTLLEINRRQDESDANLSRAASERKAITISREFGCEAYPMAEHLKGIMEKRTGRQWALMDKALLEEVASNHKLSEEILHGLGEKTRILDEILATFTPHWKSEKEHFRLLCRHMFLLAEKGNVIIVGRGGAIVTQPLKNCYHFRMYATKAFKEASIAKRLSLSSVEAAELVARKQKQRDDFIHDFLDQDARDMQFYHLLLNNTKMNPERIAQVIADYVQDT